MPPSRIHLRGRLRRGMRLVESRIRLFAARQAALFARAGESLSPYTLDCCRSLQKMRATREAGDIPLRGALRLLPLTGRR